MTERQDKGDPPVYITPDQGCYIMAADLRKKLTEALMLLHDMDEWYRSMHRARDVAAEKLNGRNGISAGLSDAMRSEIRAYDGPVVAGEPTANVGPRGNGGEDQG